MYIKNKKSSRNLLISTIALAGTLSGLALASDLSNVQAAQTVTQIEKVKAAKKAKIKKLTRIYNKYGKRIGKKTLKKGKKIKVYGTRKIKGKKYCSLGHGKYVLVKNIVFTKNKSKKVDNEYDVAYDGDCVLTYNIKTDTLHIAAGKNGNQLGKDLLVNMVLDRDDFEDYDWGTQVYNGLVPNYSYDDLDYEFYGVQHISFDSDVVLPEDSSKIFSGLDQLEDIKGLDKLDTSKVTNMSHMFEYDNNLHTLDISSWDTSKVDDMSYMFSGDESLTSLKTKNNDPKALGNANTKKDHMFDDTYLNSNYHVNNHDDNDDE